MMSDDAKEKQITRALKAAVAFLIALRFALALYYPVFSDATRYLYIAKQVAANPAILADPSIYYYPPLLYITGAILYIPLGEIGLKLVAPIFGAIGIYFTYRLGRELFDERVGLLSAVFLGIIPAHIYLSSMGYMDALVTGLSIMFVYYFYKAFDSNKNVITAGASAGLAALSKATGPAVFPFMIVFVTLKTMLESNLRSIDTKAMIRSGCVFLIGAIIAGLYYAKNLILFGHPLFPEEGVGKTIYNIPGTFGAEYNKDFSIITIYQESPTAFDYLKEVYLDFWGVPQGQLSTITFIPEIVVVGFLLFTILLSAIYIYGFLKGVKERKLLIVNAWLLTWLIAVLILPPGYLLWGFRRLLPIAPFLALLAGYGFERVKYKKILCIILVFAVITLPASQIGKAWYARSYFDKYSDSLEYLKTLPDDPVILTPYDEQTLYYSEKRARNIAHLDVDAFNLTTLKKYDISYLVRSDCYLWYDLGEHNRVIDEMAVHGDVSLVWEDRSVKVFRVNY